LSIAFWAVILGGSPFLPLEPGHGFGEGDQAGSGSGVDDPWRKLGHQKNADAV